MPETCRLHAIGLSTCALSTCRTLGASLVLLSSRFIVRHKLDRLLLCLEQCDGLVVADFAGLAEKLVALISIMAIPQIALCALPVWKFLPSAFAFLAFSFFALAFAVAFSAALAFSFFALALAAALAAGFAVGFAFAFAFAFVFLLDTALQLGILVLGGRVLPGCPALRTVFGTVMPWSEHR